MRLLESHARRCYELLADGGLRSAQALAKKLKGADLPQSLNPETSPPAICAACAGAIWRTRKRLKPPSTGLRAGMAFQARDTQRRKGGRPTERYTVNPRVRHSPSKMDTQTATNQSG